MSDIEKIDNRTLGEFEISSGIFFIIWSVWIFGAKYGLYIYDYNYNIIVREWWIVFLILLGTLQIVSVIKHNINLRRAIIYIEMNIFILLTVFLMYRTGITDFAPIVSGWISCIYGIVYVKLGRIKWQMKN